MTSLSTVDRMRAERETIATERTAVGKREAAQIHSAAERDARIVQADATVKAADIEANRGSKPQIYGRAYAGNWCCCCAPGYLGHRGHPDFLGSSCRWRAVRVLVDGPKDVQP